MTKVDGKATLDSISRTVYWLLATVCFIFFTILIMLQLAHHETQSKSRLMNRYHLVVTESSLKLLNAINQTRYRLLEFDHAKHLTEQSQINTSNYPRYKRDQVVALRYSILNYVGTLAELMLQFPHDEFKRSQRKVINLSNQLLDQLNTLAYSDQDIDYKVLDELVEPIAAATDQVYQLHHDAYRELIYSVEESLDSGQLRLLLMTFILTALGLFGAIRMLRHVRQTLFELTTTQQLLSISEQRLQEAEHVSHMGYVDWDLKRNRMTWSKEIFCLHHYATDLPMNIDNLLLSVHQADLSKVKSIIESLKSNQHRDSFKYRINHIDDQIIFINAKAAIEQDSKGNVNRILLTLIDITEQKLIELELEKYRHHLEELVEERSRKLEKAQATLMRRQRLSTLGQLTATVSHELRNPLGAMRPALYILQQNMNTDEQKIKDALNRLDRNIERCDNIIDELLDFTRIRELRYSVVVFDDWLKQLIKEQIFEDEMLLESHFCLESTSLSLDSDRLTRAIVNVITNACEAMINNEKYGKNKRLRIETCQVSKRIEIAISDNGKGIDDETMENIFEPLFSTKTFGVGLGMPTVKHIMEQHGGGIEITSEKTKGTTIILWLPVSTLGQNKGISP